MSKLQIWTNGVPAHTKISVMAPDGTAVPLQNVGTLELLLSPETKPSKPNMLRLGFLTDHIVEIELPITELVAGRILEISSTWVDLYGAVGRVPRSHAVEDAAARLAELERLYRAVCRVVGLKIDDPDPAPAPVRWSIGEPGEAA